MCYRERVAQRRKRLLVIRDPAQWKTLFSPVRIDLVELLAIVGPCSVARLAELLGRPADALYHHLRKLLATGLVVEAGEQRAGKRNETLYNLVADRFRLEFDPRRPALIKRLSGAILRMAQRDLNRSLDAGEFQGRKNGFARRLTAWLPANARSRVMSDLKSIERVAVAARQKAEGKLYSLTLFMVPLAPHARATRRTKK